MCGFVGFAGEDGSWDYEPVVRAMAQAIAHRGPDDEGFFAGETAALGFRRLAIIDIEGAHQPLSNEDGRFVLCFNGEIYNYRQLRERLAAAGHRFATQGDAEVVLHGFEEWGPSLLAHLRGMFAFALYDRANDELFCARDAFGIKPLYYYPTAHQIAFASEIKGLVPYPRFVKRLNTRRLAHYLCLEYLPDAETLFEGVFNLPAGHWMRWRAGKLQVQRWFWPRFAPDAQTSLQESANAITEAVRDSVTAHAVADVEVGCFLSAGVDSSLVAYEASKLMDAKTFSIGYGEERFSELEAARTFADVMGLSNHRCVLDAQAFFESVPRVQYAMDEPLPNPSAVPLYHLCQLAAQSVKVVLSGEGADEIFGGYPLYQECLAYEAYAAVPARLRAAAGAAGAHLPEGIRGRRFLMRGAHPLRERYIRLEYVYPFAEACDLLQPELASGAEAPWMLTRPLFSEIAQAGVDEATAMQTADLLTWLPHDILLKADKMSMAASLELRVPFLDRRVFGVARTLPTPQRVGRTETKVALRAAAARTLPPRTAAMPKMGFPTPLAQWLREEPWTSLVRAELNSETARRYFRVEKLNVLLDEHLAGKRSHMKKIWSIYCFHVWHRQYFEEAHPSV